MLREIEPPMHLQSMLLLGAAWGLTHGLGGFMSAQQAQMLARCLAVWKDALRPVPKLADVSLSGCCRGSMTGCMWAHHVPLTA